MKSDLDFGLRPRGLTLGDDALHSKIDAINAIVSPTAQADNTDNFKRISLDHLHPFYDHAFKIRPEEELMQMAESIKAIGVLHPIIVRPKGTGEYEILAGHNRVEASKLAGLTDIPAKILSVDNDTAILIMTDTNLVQAERRSYSEKAKAYKMQLDVYKRQGKRTDLEETETFCQIGNKSDGADSTQLIADKYSEKKRDVHRYIRLNHLIPDLMEWMDAGKFTLRIGAELSYLSAEEQDILLDILLNPKCRAINTEMAVEIHKLAGAFTADQAEALLLSNVADRPDPPEPVIIMNTVSKHLKSHLKKLAKVCPEKNLDPEELERRLIAATQEYMQSLQESEN